VAWAIFPCEYFNQVAISELLAYLSNNSFFCGQMHVFRPRTDLARCLLAFFPLLCAALIAISRLDDYRHDVWDVTIGATLGMSVGWFSYRRYYPPLRSVRCDTPYDKADLAGHEGFGRLDDEEQAISRPLVPRHSSGLEDSYQMEHMEMSSAS
jgi:diacylglycerol diphosphate phosphatase/phosphatidate phosphatase